MPAVPHSARHGPRMDQRPTIVVQIHILPIHIIRTCDERRNWGDGEEEGERAEEKDVR